MDNLPSALAGQRETLTKCLIAFGNAATVHSIYLFGSYARGNAHSDSDVDLCIVADGAEKQLQAAARFREQIWDIWPRPALTLIPITPKRLAEKKASNDHFFSTVLKEGVLLATQD